MMPHLALTPFEEFILRGDRPGHPQSIFVRLHLSGRLDLQAVRSAVRVTRDRHPLCRAAVAETRRGRLEWRPVDDELDVVRVLTSADDGGFRRLDLARRGGVSVDVLPGAQASSLDVQIHHAVCDGRGSLQLFHDFLIAYGAARGDEHAHLSALSTDQLHDRGRFGLTPLTWLRILPQQLLGIIGVRRALFRSIAALGPAKLGEESTEVPRGFPHIRTRDLGLGVSQRFQQVARRMAVSENDLLLRDMYLALRGWLRSEGRLSERRWLRLAIPFDLRLPGQRRMPAANVMSLVFLDRRGTILDRPQQLLESIRGELWLIKNWRLALTFVTVLRILRTVPCVWRKATGIARCMSTALVTNLGPIIGPRAFRRPDGRIAIDDLVLAGLDLVAPLRPHTPAAFCLFRYARRWFVTLHFDPRELSDGQAEALLEAFADQVAETAGNG